MIFPSRNTKSAPDRVDKMPQHKKSMYIKPTKSTQANCTAPCASKRLFWAKFPHSPIHHYTSIYGALLFSVSPVRCTCIIKYGAVRKFFPILFLQIHNIPLKKRQSTDTLFQIATVCARIRKQPCCAVKKIKYLRM